MHCTCFKIAKRFADLKNNKGTSTLSNRLFSVGKVMPSHRASGSPVFEEARLDHDDCQATNALLRMQDPGNRKSGLQQTVGERHSAIQSIHKKPEHPLRNIQTLKSHTREHLLIRHLRYSHLQLQPSSRTLLHTSIFTVLIELLHPIDILKPHIPPNPKLQCLRTSSSSATQTSNPL